MKRKSPFVISSTKSARPFFVPVAFQIDIEVQAVDGEEAHILASAVAANVRRYLEQVMAKGCTCRCKPFTQHAATCFAYPTRRLS